MNMPTGSTPLIRRFINGRKIREEGESRIPGPSRIRLRNCIFPFCYHSVCLRRIFFLTFRLLSTIFISVCCPFSPLLLHPAFLFPFRHRLMTFLLLFGLLAASFYLSFEVSRSFFDLSYDGQAYHQEALIQLVRGWNPVYQQLNGPEANNMHRWLNHYSKGVWFYESVIFQVTQNMEAAKLFHLWLMMAAFSITLSFLLRIQGIADLARFPHQPVGRFQSRFHLSISEFLFRRSTHVAGCNSRRKPGIDL